MKCWGSQRSRSPKCKDNISGYDIGCGSECLAWGQYEGFLHEQHGPKHTVLYYKLQPQSCIAHYTGSSPVIIHDQIVSYPSRLDICSTPIIFGPKLCVTDSVQIKSYISVMWREPRVRRIIWAAVVGNTGLCCDENVGCCCRLARPNCSLKGDSAGWASGVKVLHGLWLHCCCCSR